MATRLNVLNLPGTEWSLAGTHLTGTGISVYVVMEETYGFLPQDVLLISEAAPMFGEIILVGKDLQLYKAADLPEGMAVIGTVITLIRSLGITEIVELTNE